MHPQPESWQHNPTEPEFRWCRATASVSVPEMGMSPAAVLYVESNARSDAAQPDSHYVIYFTDGGAVDIQLPVVAGDLKLLWISIQSGTLRETLEFEHSGILTLTPPSTGGWVAVLLRQ